MCGAELVTGRINQFPELQLLFLERYSQAKHFLFNQLKISTITDLVETLNLKHYTAKYQS